MATILVVDDDPDIGIMLKMMLEFKGYEVILLNRAAKTKETLSQNKVDLVILDMLIAGENGTDICASIRGNAAFAHLPVLMISALSDAKPACLQAGANEFLSKPFEMQDLLSRIECLLNKSEAPAAPIPA